VPLRRPVAQPRSPHVGRATVIRCGRVAEVRLKGSLAVADSNAETGSRAAHRAETRTPVQPPGKEQETMKRSHRSQKHAEGDRPAKRPWGSRRVALTEQLEKVEDKSTPPYPQSKKAGRRRNWKCRHHKDPEMSSARINTSTHAIGTSPRKRRSDDTSVCYSGRAALRSRQHGMSAESRNRLITGDVHY
jgi:hypothetical protein